MRLLLLHWTFSLIFVLQTVCGQISNSGCSVLQTEEHLFKTMMRLELSFEELKNRVQVMEFSNRETLQSVRNTQVAVENALEEIKTKDDRMKFPNIAFNSRILEDLAPTTNQAYIFKEIPYNYGESYDNSTGIFTAPVDGKYFFTVSMCTSNGHYTAYAIVAKNVDLARSTVYGTSGNPCNSLSAIVLLNVSDQVFVRATYSLNQANEDATYRWNTFSGALIN